MAPAKTLTQADLDKFRGGQVRVVSSPQGFAYFSEISGIILVSQTVRIGVAWLATKHGNKWIGSMHRSARAINLMRCQFEWGVGVNFEVLTIDCIDRRELITFYPFGHPSGIKSEDVQLVPVSV